MIKIQNIIDQLEIWYPPDLAEPWDKIGLQIGNPESILKKIFITLDIREASVKEAIRQKANLIISHHPFIFDSISNLIESDPRTKIISLLLKNQLSVYISHTNLDFAEKGTSHYLAQKLGLINIEPLSPLFNQKYKKMVVFVPSSHAERVSRAMFDQGAGIIGDYSHCSFRQEGTGTFKGSDQSKPYLGKAGQFEITNEIRLEVLVPAHKVQAVVQSMKSAHPYEEVAYDIYTLENPNLKASKGVIGYIPKSIPVNKWVITVKTGLKLKTIRLIGERNIKIRKIAIVTGSGSDFIQDAKLKNCDLLITGDMKYHQALSALDLDLAVLDLGHYQSESIYLPYLADRLRKYFKTNKLKIPVLVSNTGADPFQSI